MIGNAVIHDSSERRVKLENVLKRAASGQTLSDKTPANSRYGSFGQLQKSPEGLQLILTKSGIAWVSEDGREHEIIPLLLADVVYAEVAQKFSFTTPDATHLIAIAPRIQSLAAVWLLCTNAGTGDFSLDHLMISFSRRGAIRWDIKDCCHFSAKCCGQGAHGSVFSGVSLLPLYDSRRRLLPEKRDVINMQKVHNFGRVAVKIWNKPPMSMIRQEVYALQAAAGHPNICSLLGLYCEGPRRKTAVIWLLALEHCTGGDLFDLIRDNYISQLQVMDILFGLFSALAHVHSLQLVHRDIKAENVVLKKHHAVLIDFGISANVNDEQEMMRPVGSPGYAAPEVIALVPERYNEKVDVFATGVLCYFMLFRTLPFWADTQEDILNKTRACEVHYPDEESRPVRPELIGLMDHLIQKKPEDRPSSLEAFLKLRDSAPDEVLQDKGGRAYRAALAGLVKLGHLPASAAGAESFEEFSEESPDVSELPSTQTTTERPSVWRTVTGSALRQISSFRLPRVRPTLSKVLGIFHSSSRLALPGPVTGKRSKTTDDARRSLVASPESNPNEDQEGHAFDDTNLALQAAEAATPTVKGHSEHEASTAAGSESFSVSRFTESGKGSKDRLGSKSSYPKASGSLSLDSHVDEQISKSPNLPVHMEEDEEQSSFKEAGHHVEEDELLGKVDDVDSLMESEAGRSCRPNAVSPELAEAPPLEAMGVIAAPAAPSTQPPALVPVAPTSPAPAVPKHRQRGLAVFRTLLSAQEQGS